VFNGEGQRTGQDAAECSTRIKRNMKSGGTQGGRAVRGDKVGRLARRETKRDFTRGTECREGEVDKRWVRKHDCGEDVMSCTKDGGGGTPAKGERTPLGTG